MDHEIKQQLISGIREKMETARQIRDITAQNMQMDNPYVQDIVLEDRGLSDGTVRIRVRIKDEYYYKMLRELSGVAMDSEYALIHKMCIRDRDVSHPVPRRFMMRWQHSVRELTV